MLGGEFDQALYPHLDVFELLTGEGREENLQCGGPALLLQAVLQQSGAVTAGVRDDTRHNMIGGQAQKDYIMGVGSSYC